MMTKEPTTIEVTVPEPAPTKPAAEPAAPAAPAATPALNAEQEATARKEGRKGFNFPIYAVTAKRIVHERPNPAPPIQHATIPVWPPPREPDEAITYIEAERFIDARAFACRILGCSEVDIARLEVTNGHRPFPRWQIRTHGYNASITSQARRLHHAFEFSDDEKGWRDVRGL